MLYLMEYASNKYREFNKKVERLQSGLFHYFLLTYNFTKSMTH